MWCAQLRSARFDRQKRDTYNQTERQRDIDTDVHVEIQTHAAHAVAIFIEEVVIFIYKKY